MLYPRTAPRHIIRPKNLKIVLLTVLFCLLLSPFQARTQESSQEKIKTALLFRFMHYIEWPNEKTLQQFNIKFVGEDSKLYDEINKASQSIKIRDRHIRVTPLNSSDADGNQYQLFLLTKLARINHPS
ncbi:MAG: hypothetical protein ACJA0N_002249 [Pseudohongiellaceae bacterium]|jgi:hypothetical protein